MGKKMRVYRLNSEDYFIAHSIGEAIDTHLENTGNHISDILDDGTCSLPLSEAALRSVELAPGVTAFDLYQEHVRENRPPEMLFNLEMPDDEYWQLAFDDDEDRQISGKGDGHAAD
jgi:hypothetical protein